MCSEPSNARPREMWKTRARGLRERPTRVLGQFSLPERNHGTQQRNFQGWQFALNGESHLLEWDSFSRRRLWFHGSLSRQAPRLIHLWNLGRALADTPSRVTRQTTRTSNYFDYAVSLLASLLPTMNSLETMPKR